MNWLFFRYPTEMQNQKRFHDEPVVIVEVLYELPVDTGTEAYHVKALGGSWRKSLLRKITVIIFGQLTGTDLVDRGMYLFFTLLVEPM